MLELAAATTVADEQALGHRKTDTAIVVMILATVAAVSEVAGAIRARSAGSNLIVTVPNVGGFLAADVFMVSLDTTNR